MASKSSIEWTDMTWNPVTGCSKVSQGCKFCYAERFAKRLQGMGVERYRHGFKVVLHENALEEPFSWRKPRMVFVNSMSDLFHDDVPLEFIRRVFDVMNRCPQHVFQVLTKRSERLRDISSDLNWTSNIWIGVSVESQQVAHRIFDLQTVPAVVRFLSCEPLIGPLGSVSLERIDWVIVGGESGPGARPMKQLWVEEIMIQCRLHHVPFFFKQWGGVRKKQAGRKLNGKTYDEFPHVLQSSI